MVNSHIVEKDTTLVFNTKKKKILIDWHVTGHDTTKNKMREYFVF